MCLIGFDGDQRSENQCNCSSQPPQSAVVPFNSKTAPQTAAEQSNMIPSHRSVTRIPSQTRLLSNFAKSDHSLCQNTGVPDALNHVHTASHATLNPFQAHGDAPITNLSNGDEEQEADSAAETGIKFYIEDADDPCEGLLIGSFNDKFRIQQLVNRGAFGRIYRGVRLKTGEKVAIKAENQGTGHEKILTEGHMYQKLEECVGMPQVHWYGMHGSEFNFLVMDLMGSNMQDLQEKRPNKAFSLTTVVKILMNLLQTLEYMHDMNIMHRDISPRNIVIGRGDQANKVFLIDLGLAKTCTRKGQIMLNSPSRFSAYINPFVGTPRYASLKSHRGSPMGRSDDLESLGYVMVQLFKGGLPWQESKLDIDVDDDFEEALKRIEEMKVLTPVEELCEGLPDEFATLISYARLLKLHEGPDYKSITKLFDNLIQAHQLDLTAPFDWEAPRATEHSAHHVPAPSLRPNQSSRLAHGRSGSDEAYSTYNSCANCHMLNISYCSCG